MSAVSASRLRSRVVIAAAVTGGTALGASCVHRLQRNADARPHMARIQLPPTLVEAIAGAMGEVSQIIALYPLDTIKVRCQSMGQSSGEVIRGLLAQGVNRRLLRKLYAGAWGAALCSVLVGAVHFASFETSRRLLLQHLPAAQQPAATAATAAACATAEARFCAVGNTSQAAGTSAAAWAEGQSPQQQHQQHQQHQHPGSERWMVNILAAAFAALATAVVESPVELFRHNQQAGIVKGDFMREMASVVRRQGPSGLYWGFLPHCFEAWPHDISELWVYGSMKDLAHDISHAPAGSPHHHTALAHLPSHVWDLSTGAAAGAAAVLISMPFDCVKTYLQTHGTDMAGKGLRGSAALFVRTGADMVRRGGVGALYYGVVPRLLQQVPASTVGWYVIHTVQRLLEPYTAPTTFPTAAAVGAAAVAAALPPVAAIVPQPPLAVRSASASASAAAAGSATAVTCSATVATAVAGQRHRRGVDGCDR